MIRPSIVHAAFTTSSEHALLSSAAFFFFQMFDNDQLCAFQLAFGRECFSSRFVVCELDDDWALLTSCVIYVEVWTVTQ